MYHPLCCRNSERGREGMSSHRSERKCVVDTTDLDPRDRLDTEIYAMCKIISNVFR